MTDLLLAIAALALLYFSRRKLTSELARLVYRLGGSQKTFIIFWSLMFLPGTIIHELSHFFAAAMTGAKTGKIEIFPDFAPSSLGNEKTVRSTHLGFVQTQALGPLRGFFVGTAPLFVGLGLLVWISNDISLELSTFNFQLPTLLKLYLFFTISNSLFPSWADVKHALPFIVLAIFAAIIAWFAGINLSVSGQSPILSLLSPLAKTLLLSSGLNLLMTLTAWSLKTILGNRKTAR